jgi:hypothetical protein
MMETRDMRIVCVLLLAGMLVPMVARAQQPPPWPQLPPIIIPQTPPGPPPASADIAAVYALIAPDLEGQAVRTEISSLGNGLLLRVTPSNPEAERRRQRPSSDVALEARVVKDAAGDIARLTVAGNLVPRRRIVVGEMASEAARSNALRQPQLGADDAADVRSLVRARVARGPARAATPTSDPTLVWRRVGAQEEAMWEIPVELPTRRGKGTYVARFSAGDGTLIELERMAGASGGVVR